MEYLSQVQLQIQYEALKSYYNVLLLSLQQLAAATRPSLDMHSLESISDQMSIAAAQTYSPLNEYPCNNKMDYIVQIRRYSLEVQRLNSILKVVVG